MRNLAKKFSNRVFDIDVKLPLVILCSVAFIASVSLAPLGFMTSPRLRPAGPLNRSRIAVCLVGGARRFELTGPSIVERILRVYDNSDLFLHSPLDSNSYKLLLLNAAPRIAAVRIFKPEPIPETPSEARVLTARHSPNGIQGLLQYFNLVEGCLTMIKSHQEKNNFTYDWIIRTRVDGYWSDSLGPENFISGEYLVPPGSSYGGLNDRFGIGDYETSVAALSRLSSIPQLDSAGLTQLNSEMAFKAQLKAQKVRFTTNRLPFCVVSDREYDFPPEGFGVPVAALSSPGPLSGAKCRPCRPTCTGSCVGPVMNGLQEDFGWTEWADDSLELCDSQGPWEKGWERLFDYTAGKTLASAREWIRDLDMGRCVEGFENMRRQSAQWDGHAPEEICGLGLESRGRFTERVILLCGQVNSSCVDSDWSDGSDCAVCLERMCAGDSVSRLPCRHIFHKLCLDGWLAKINFSCPLCRAPTVSEERVEDVRRRVVGDLAGW